MSRLCVAEVAEWQREAVWWLMAAGSTMSLVGSGFVLLCFLALSRPGRNPMASLVALLAAADFGWAATNLLSLSAVALSDRLVADLSSWPACVAFRGLFQFFAGATVLWTCCIAYFLYRTISKPTKAGVAWYEWTCFHAICWGLPLVDTLVLAFFGHATLERHQAIGLCYPRGIYHVLSWLLPVTCAFLFNLVLYLAILIKLRTRMKWAAGSISRKLGSRFSLYLFVFLLSWAPTVLNGVTEFVNDQRDTKCHVVILVALSNFLLTSQGMWNGLVYGLSNRRVRAQFGTARKALQTLLLVVSAPFLVLPAFAFFLARTIGCGCTGKAADPEKKETRKKKKEEKENERREIRAMSVNDAPSADELEGSKALLP